MKGHGKALKGDVLFSYGLLWAYCGGIFYASSQPIPPQTLPQFNDKWLHFMEYALLGVLTLNALRRSFRTQAWRPLMFWAWIFACLYGLSDEIHQSFVPERFMEAGDFIADCLGALGGIFGLRLASKGIGGLKR